MGEKKNVFGTETPVALVTGAGKQGRVGRVIAERLAERGYAIVVHAHTSLSDARSFVTDLQATGTAAKLVPADLADAEAIDCLVASAHTWRDRLDVLINTAAIWESKTLEEVTASDVESHWRINTLATFLCSQKAGLIMAEQTHGGAIVNFGDWATVRPYAEYAAYFPSKTAIEGMTRNLAVELARRNPSIRVNAILPGTVTLSNSMASNVREEAIAETLLQRAGTPDNIAQAVVALIENDFITGAVLPVDGGRSVAVPGEAAWRESQQP